MAEDRIRLKDLLKKDLVFVREYGNFYYIRPKPKSEFDELVWKVNKDTGIGVPIHLIDYFDVHDKAKDVNVKKLYMLIK